MSTRLLDLLGNPSIATAKRLGGIQSKAHDVNIVEFGQGTAIELGAQTILRLMNARGIDKDKLTAGAIDDGAHATASRLSNRRSDGDLLTIARVHQGRFTRVRTADQSDKAASEALRAIGIGGLLDIDTIKTSTLREQGVELFVAQALKGIELFNIGHEYS